MSLHYSYGQEPTAAYCHLIQRVGRCEIDVGIAAVFTIPVNFKLKL